MGIKRFVFSFSFSFVVSHFFSFLFFSLFQWLFFDFISRCFLLSFLCKLIFLFFFRLWSSIDRYGVMRPTVLVEKDEESMNIEEKRKIQQKKKVNSKTERWKVFFHFFAFSFLFFLFLRLLFIFVFSHLVFFYFR